MPPRQVACDPCRFSKLACDHSKPVCSRCRERDQATNCVYRTRPFKRKRLSSDYSGLAPPETEIAITSPPSTSRRYPNAGYQGSSSHDAIFDRLSIENHNGTASDANDTMETLQGMPGSLVDDAQVRHGASLLERMANVLQIPLCQKLVRLWTSKGVNLALSGAFTEECAMTAGEIFNSLKFDSEAQELAVASSRRLFTCSCQPIGMCESSTIADFQTSFTQHNARWETLGLFFTAVSRATMDFTSFEPLYSREHGRRHLRKTAMQFSDSCLEIALSLDCLNDLQLVLQYENFILHSYADGDQSYHSWRRLGDVISSLFALGYHEKIDNHSASPTFLKDLRKSTLARTYSADKNISIFLGRPPRLLRKYCKLELPGGAVEGLRVNDGIATYLPIFQNWPPTEEFDYMIDTCWSAACALLKEDISDLSREEIGDKRNRLANNIQANADALWLALPTRFRLHGPLKLSTHKPIDSDFMVSARLNHLHVLFLLRLAILRQTPEADSELLTVSANMLSLTVEAMLLKDRLANSGTSLVWKVAYYGLRAAGVICLSLLHQAFTVKTSEISVAEVFQNLNVLVAQVETGAFAHFDHPNYELLARAARTIKNVLSRVLSGELSRPPAKNEAVPQILPPSQEDWIPWIDQDSWDFEIDFWRNLADHPELVGMDSTLNGLL